MRFLPLLPVAALLCLAGCSQNPPSPQAALSCEQYRVTGDFDYLNCLRGYQAQNSAPPAAQAAPAAPAAR